jgi:hypothetical protein
VAANTEEGGVAWHGSEGWLAVEFQGRSMEQWKQSWRGSSTQYELHAEACRRNREKIWREHVRAGVVGWWKISQGSQCQQASGTGRMTSGPRRKLFLFMNFRITQKCTTLQIEKPFFPIFKNQGKF